MKVRRFKRCTPRVVVLDTDKACYCIRCDQYIAAEKPKTVFGYLDKGRPKLAVMHALCAL